MTSRDRVVFLLDCDNTLLDNDRVQDDLRSHLEREFGAASSDRYWAILNGFAPNWGMRIIWVHYSAIGSGTWATRGCC